MHSIPLTEEMLKLIQAHNPTLKGEHMLVRLLGGSIGVLDENAVPHGEMSVELFAGRHVLPFTPFNIGEAIRSLVLEHVALEGEEGTKLLLSNIILEVGNA